MDLEKYAQHFIDRHTCDEIGNCEVCIRRYPCDIADLAQEILTLLDVVDAADAFLAADDELHRIEKTNWTVHPSTMTDRLEAKFERSYRRSLYRDLRSALDNS